MNARRRSTTSTTALIGAMATLTATVATIFAATNAFAPDTAPTPIRVRDQRRDPPDRSTIPAM